MAAPAHARLNYDELTERCQSKSKYWSRPEGIFVHFPDSVRDFPRLRFEIPAVTLVP